MDVSRTDHINGLYHKSRATGLAGEKKEEQARLRKECITAIRGSLRSNLNNILIQEEDGPVTDLGKKYGGIKEIQRQKSGSAVRGGGDYNDVN